MAKSRQIEAGRAAVRIIGDDQGLQKTLRRTQLRLKSWGKAIATTGAAAVAAFIPTIKAASDAQETMNKFNVVFAQNADAVKDWADEFAHHIGRSRRQIAAMLADSQDLLVPIGFDASEAEETSKQLTQLAIDLASFNNMADGDVMRDLHAALTGSGEVMKKYGVIVSETAVKQELLNDGMDPARVTEQQKALARFNIIMRGTTAAHGDAARSAGSLANQTKRLLARLEDIAVTIGTAIMPQLERMADRLGESLNIMSQWVKDHPQITAAMFNIAAGATALGVAMQGVGLALGPLGTMGAIFSGQVAADRMRERRARTKGFMAPTKDRPAAGGRLVALAHGNNSVAPVNRLPSINSPRQAPFDATAQRAAQIQLLQQQAAGEKLNLTMKQQGKQVARTSKAWSRLWNVLAAGTVLKSIGSLLGRQGLLGALLRVGPALLSIGKGTAVALVPLAAVAAKVLALAGVVAGLVYGIYKLPEAINVAVGLLDEWAQSNAAVAATLDGLRTVFGVVGDAIKGWADIATTAFNAVAKGAVWAAGQVKDAFNTLTFDAVPTVAGFFDASGDLKEQERQQQESADAAKEAAGRMWEAQQQVREAVGNEDWGTAVEGAEQYVESLQANIEALKENGAGAVFLKKRLEQLATAEEELGLLRVREEGARREQARVEQLEKLATIQGELNRLGANDQQRRVMAIEAETQALRDQATEMGVLTDEVKRQLNAQESSRIAKVLNEPIRELQAELEQLRIDVDTVGLSDLERDLDLLKREHEQAVELARRRGIEDENYYDMLSQKYRLLAVQQRQMNDARIEGAERSMRQDIAHLEIDASDMDDLEKRMAKLEVDFADDLRRALEEGLDPDLVRRRYQLLAELAEQEFEPEGPKMFSSGTFNPTALLGLQPNDAADRTANAVEAMLDHTRRIEKNTREGGTW